MATSTMETNTAIEATKLYPLPVFKKITGLGLWAMRTARRNGLRVRYVGGKAFVMGSDFLDYLDRINTEDAAGSVPEAE